MLTHYYDGQALQTVLPDLLMQWLRHKKREDEIIKL